ncbi:uncharacterized membrane protein YhaH (DUF805 family) [Dysgonomonas sp. PFB1-18]|uniref:DUF805 domain-containing protein n=1 Tax=unclassified Dysgonomonas TaxID=2630389 RepID=UPI002476BA5D|nr:MULTISPECIES: DUF805 domain-containing protein [unclassified Dysgonomonas]MDH6308266.1 uncharacterized membrane protein YhaH (DUF805 family) [Dysgonomonas sp. PF1-14]MDH6338295.1 uncharacterized membrane protein YhaH (DUF805 family) [Dysgonomonas sp. PF1-16]MDH6379792.1 uncharacterized membrane protein YhaH (DUF805 family) [Dysgonomonas sp. PFB1-18]MDH6397118.1 uncharacterized membrane protein YhaH (DUF805 family) [Dysgonomonas sp. PF1-23]
MKWFLKVVMKHYADFNGRARRKEYWMFTLVSIIGMIVMYIVSLMLAFVSSTLGIICFSILGLILLALTIPSIAVLIRRMHDVGKDWWYIFIPVYSFILAITEGEKGSNRYGSDPKA